MSGGTFTEFSLVTASRTEDGETPMTEKSESRQRRAIPEIGVHELEVEHIREQWVTVTNTPPPRYVSRVLLRRMLADYIQTAESGGLSRATRSRLLKIGIAAANGDAIPNLPVAKLRPGSVLVRDWRGRRHQVIALESGFSYENQTYDNLSEIARHITGTRWSGPVFFGLRKAATAKRPA